MTRIEILRGKNIKAGDTKPALRAKLFEGEYPFNLDGYDVQLKLSRANGDTSLDESATVDIAQRGIITYSWQSGDTDTEGTYKMEVVADDGAGRITFPNDGYHQLYIEKGL